MGGKPQKPELRAFRGWGYTSPFWGCSGAGWGSWRFTGASWRKEKRQDAPESFKLPEVIPTGSISWITYFPEAEYPIWILYRLRGDHPVCLPFRATDHGPDRRGAKTHTDRRVDTAQIIHRFPPGIPGHHRSIFGPYQRRTRPLLQASSWSEPY